MSLANIISSAKSFISQILIVSSLIILSACGSDGAKESVETTPPEETNTPPTLSVSSPNQGDSQDAGELTTLTATATDVEDGNLSANIQWSSNIDGSLGTGANISVQLTTGNHLINATVTDSDNVSSNASVNYMVNDDDNNNTTPSLSITSPANGASQTLGTATTFTATATDTEDGDISSNILWASNLDGNLGTGSSVTATLTVGNHIISALITDSGALSDNDAINYFVTVAGAPNLAITSPTSGGSQPVGESTTLTATANDQEDGNLSSIIQWSSDIDGILGTGASITYQLSLGEHVITAEVTDSDGLTATSIINYTLTSSALGAATLSWTAPNENTDDSELTDLAGFKIYYGTSENALSDSIVINSTSTLTHVFNSLTTGQTYYFAVTAYNESGIESVTSDIASKFIDG